MTTTPTGVEQITDARAHQFERGYTAEHDEHHTVSGLVAAAFAYADHAAAQVDLGDDDKRGMYREDGVHVMWPWEPEAWKPSDEPSYNLARAGAFIAAAIDRWEAAAAAIAEAEAEQEGDES